MPKSLFADKLLVTWSILSFFPLYLVLIGVPEFFAIALLVFFTFATLLADILTVRLIVAGKRRGIFGYET